MTFDAWSLPDGWGTPDVGTLEGPDGSRIAFPDVTADWLSDLAGELASGRRRLLARSALDLADTLGRAAARFLDPVDPLRMQALEHLPGTSGLSGEMSAAVLDGMAADWTADRLRDLVRAEFGDPPALDAFVPSHLGSVRAMGAGLTTQIVAGSVPGVGGSALLRSLLVKSPTLLKPGRGDVVLPVLLARAIREEDPELSAVLAVLYWPGGRDDLTAAAVGAAGAVVAYGGDEAVHAVRAQTHVTSRFVGYHHRVSVGVVGLGGLSPDRVVETASEVAGSVAFFDQRGCVSPQVVYVERGGDVDPEEFASRVAEALGVIETHLPGGALEPEEASAVQQTRGTAELLAASGRGVGLYHGGDASWTVVFDPSREMTTLCAGRTIRLVPVDDVEAVPALLRPLSRHLQTVAITGCGGRIVALADALAEVGVTRVARFHQAPFPPPWWHHDGLGPLRALVEWTDLEARA